MDKDYFIDLEKIKKSHSFITAEEVEMKKKSQKRQIIDLLLDRFPGRVTNLELNKIGFRYGQRIKELRNEGWEIENVRDRSQSEKVWVAWLESPVKGDRPYIPKYVSDPRDRFLGISKTEFDAVKEAKTNKRMNEIVDNLPFPQKQTALKF